MDFKYRCPAFVKESLDAITGDEKFVMTIAIGFANVILTLLGFLTGGEYITGLTLIFGSYIAGKTTEAVAESNASVKIAQVTGTAPDNKAATS